jgi:cell wall-associated NlpC family hydrolase
MEHDMQDPLPIGAHLTTPRGVFSHHGIYAGNGRVIHYAGLSRRAGNRVVEEVSLSRFTRGFGLRVKSQPESAYTGEERVARARARLGERRYRLWSNNCEHFCEWCLSGVSRSRQVETWKRRIDYTCNALGLSNMARFPKYISSEIFRNPVEIAE